MKAKTSTSKKTKAVSVAGIKAKKEA